jgi:hypothetical protein
LKSSAIFLDFLRYPGFWNLFLLPKGWSTSSEISSICWAGCGFSGLGGAGWT